MGARGQSRLLVVKVLTQQLEELIRVLSNDLGDLGVASRNLLQDGLKHVGLLLHKLAELLEVGVVAEEVQVSKIGTTCARSSAGTSSTATTTATLASLGSGLKQVDGLLATRATSGSSRGRSSRGSSTLLTLLLLLLLFLLNIVGDAL